jgi:hypothetical protein
MLLGKWELKIMDNRFIDFCTDKVECLLRLTGQSVISLFLGLWMLSGVHAETIRVGNEQNSVVVISSTQDSNVIEFTLGSFEQNEVLIQGEKYYSILLPGEALIEEKGSPDLPRLSRSLSIPTGSGVTARVLESQYVEYEMQIAPSKGALLRNVDPEEVQFSFGDTYKSNRFYPKEIVSLSKPYLLREVRGISVTVSPITYNPETKIVRVYNKLRVEVRFEGQDYRNSPERADQMFNKHFAPLYNEHFINLHVEEGMTTMPSLDDVEMLIIAADDFIDEMNPFVDHKNSIGLSTVMVGISEVGSNTDDIKSYIQNYYDIHASLTYVLLVGDHAQVPAPMYFGGGADPSYSLVSGTDNYPDIFVGRFSAETSAEVETMVERSILHETAWKGAWFHRGMGIASNQGPGDDGEDDFQHLRNIRGTLSAWHYTDVGEYYDGSQGDEDAAGNPTPADISAYVNNGVSIINYTGHGSTTSWSTSGFSNTDVNNLTNDDELPFIFSVACVNGNFTGSTSFSEAWLRAKNVATDNPVGAIGFYGSTINQYWSPPMEAQDVFNDMLVNEDYSSFGALVFNASAGMMDAYGGNDGDSGTNMFLTWTLFGDPSLKVGLGCFSRLPQPVLENGSQIISPHKSKIYSLKVKNWSSYPNQLFDSAPYLGACGLNSNASRSWVGIYNGDTNKKIYEFCTLDSNDDLTKLWFFVPRGSNVPRQVYVVIHDRHCGVKYVSNRVFIRKPTPPYLQR